MRQKDYNIEIMRIVAFIMVIVIHVANYFSRAYGNISTGEYIYSVTFNAMARVSVPCFFMMSGALLLGRCEKIEKCLKRAGKFAVVLGVWTLLYVLFNTFYTKQGCDVLHLLKKPAEAHLWYLYALIPIYIILPFLQVLCKHMGKELEMAFVRIGFIWFVVSYVLSYFKQSFYYDLPIFGDKSYIFYMFCGYLISKYKDEIRFKQKTLLAVYMMGCILIVIAAVTGASITGAHFDRFFEYGSPIVMINSICVFTYIMRMGGGSIQLSDKVKTWVDTCCGCSFGIYLIHVMFLDMYKIHIPAAQFSPYYMLPALVIAVALASFVSVFVLRKTKIGKMIL